MKFSERHLRAERQILIVTFIRRNYAIATLKAGPERIVYTIFGDHTSGVAIITWEGIRSVCLRGAVWSRRPVRRDRRNHYGQR